MIEQITKFLSEELYVNITISSRKQDKYIGYFEVYIVIEEGYFDLEFRHPQKYKKEKFTKNGETYLPITTENIEEAAVFVDNIIKENYLR
jgi:hypothetical protein